MSNVFGKAKFGGKGRTWFKLKDGSNGPYRILPPMGNLADDGRWSVFYSIHYGYKNSEGKMRTFQSPLLKNRKTKMIESPDAALDRITQLKVKLDEAKKAGNQEVVAKLLELVGGKKSRYNLDNNHYMNVVDTQGNVGILKIRHRCKLALDAEIKKLRDAGVEPLDPETGRFFTFHRSGMGMDTVYSVSVYKKKIRIENYGEVEQDVVHTIDDELARRCITQNKDGSFFYREAGRLDSLFAKPTSAEVERNVREGEKAVDEILDAKTETADTDDSGLEDDETPIAGTTTITATTPAPVTTSPATAATQPATAGGTGTYQQGGPGATYTPAQVTQTLQQQTFPPTYGAGGGTAPATTPTTSTTPKTTAQTVSELTDEEFLRNLGL